MENKLLEKLGFKPISILLFFIILCGGAVPFIPEEGESFRKLIWYIITSIVLLAAYIIFVIHQNRLPRCKKGEEGVLFVFKVVSEEQYTEFKFAIEENFKKSIKVDTIKIVPVCVNASRLKNYDINDKKYMTKLLNTTNCYFCVEFFIESDSKDRPTRYSTTINAGVLSPNVSQKEIAFLIKNLSYGTTRIHKVSFDSQDRINALHVTSDYLTILSEYAISVLLIMCNKSSEALAILTVLKNTTPKEHVLFKMINEAVYQAVLHIIGPLFDKYYITNDIYYLEQLEYYVELANASVPNQYSYHLNMAKIVFLKNRDIVSAKEHIKHCKLINENDYWKYSEAFLLAYDFENPNIVFSKYKQLEDNSYNLIEIIAFIEQILEEEPNRQLLHLALGILYDYNGDSELSSCHLKQFINNYKGNIPLRRKSLELIKEKILSDVCELNKQSLFCQNCLINK